MKFVGKYLKKYWVIAIMAPLFKMLEAVFELFVPLVMAQIIDEGIASGLGEYVIKHTLILVLLAVVGFAVAVIAQYFSAKAATLCTRDIRHDLFQKILGLSSAQADSVGTQALSTRIISDVNQVQSAINMVLRLLLRSPFIVAGAVIMAFTVDPKTAGIFVIVVPVLGIIVAFIMHYTLPRFSRIQKKLEGVFLSVSESLEGARVNRAFVLQDTEKESFIKKTEDLSDLQIQTGRISILLNPLTYIVVNLGLIFVLWVSSTQVDKGILLTGSVVALCNYMSQILVELVKFANLIVLLMKAFPSADRIEEVMKMESDERAHLDGAEVSECTDTTLELENVSFAYPNSKETSISDINCVINPGEVVGIIGGTGSGKSTLMRLLYHDFDCSFGRILLGKKDIRSYSDKQISDIFGVVPQKAALISGTVSENLSMADKNDSGEGSQIKALEAAQAYDFVSQKEGKLLARVEAGGRNFSGGQRQRLTIARGLMGDPKILILDDSASALDLATEAALKDAILNLPQKPTVFIVSQRASSVLSADKILVLEEGRCVGMGSHAELMDSCEAYQEIYYAQFPQNKENC